jgi:hypothetical protein
MLAKGRLLPWVMGCLLLNSAIAGASDWESCNEALQALRIESRRASFETLETPRKEKQLIACNKDMDSFNINHERCRRIKGEYLRQVDEMQAALARVQEAIFDVELSCYYAVQVGVIRENRFEKKDLAERMCQRLKKYTRNMPTEKQLELCRKVHFPGDCQECLTPK